MTTTPHPSRFDKAARINAAGLLGLLVGLSLVLAPAFATDTRLGLAVIGVLLSGAATWAVTYDNSRQV